MSQITKRAVAKYDSSQTAGGSVTALTEERLIEAFRSRKQREGPDDHIEPFNDQIAADYAARSGLSPKRVMDLFKAA